MPTHKNKQAHSRSCKTILHIWNWRRGSDSTQHESRQSIRPQLIKRLVLAESSRKLCNSIRAGILSAALLRLHARLIKAAKPFPATSSLQLWWPASDSPDETCDRTIWRMGESTTGGNLEIDVFTQCNWIHGCARHCSAEGRRWWSRRSNARRKSMHAELAAETWQKSGSDFLITEITCLV